MIAWMGTLSCPIITQHLRFTACGAEVSFEKTALCYCALFPLGQKMARSVVPMSTKG